MCRKQRVSVNSSHSARGSKSTESCIQMAELLVYVHNCVQARSNMVAGKERGELEAAFPDAVPAEARAHSHFTLTAPSPCFFCRELAMVTSGVQERITDWQELAWCPCMGAAPDSRPIDSVA